MPTVVLCPLLNGQYFDNNGDPLAAGLIDTFAAGTTTPLASYTTAAGTTPHANPIVLDAGGRAPEVWLVADSGYKLRLRTAAGVTLWTVDNVLLAAAPAAAQLLPAGMVFALTSQVLTPNSGASTVVASGFHPAGVTVLDMKVVVDQQLGNSLGLTGIDVGDPGTVDRWVGNGTLTVGTKTMRDGAVKFTTATDLVITALGGTFDGTGQLTVTRLTLTMS